jgi:hypothetical protein
MRNSLQGLSLLILGGAGWTLAGVIAAATIAAGIVLRPGNWLVDWSVYLAGARDFLDRTLYQQPLHSVGLPMSAFDFKLPPTAALAGLPFVGIDPQFGGVIWTIINLAALGYSTIVLARLMGIKHATAMSGVALGVFSLSPVYEITVLVGNINSLELAIVATYAQQHLRGNSRRAGWLLGAAIGVKLWPLVLIVSVLRGRAWSEFRHVVAALAVQAIVITAWLGSASIVGLLKTTQATLPYVDPGTVFFVSWLAFNTLWWPAWGGLALAALLLAIPVTGRASIGLGIVAGLALVFNLWTHYEPTFFFGLGLLAADIVATLRARGLLVRRLGTPTARQGRVEAQELHA